MNESGPTDVITFHHGEIFISADTAFAMRAQFGNSLVPRTDGSTLFMGCFICMALTIEVAAREKMKEAAENSKVLNEALEYRRYQF